MGKYIPPLFWIGHVFGRRFFLFLYLHDHLIDVDIFVSFEESLIDDIGYFFSGEFFVLCRLRYIALIRLGSDIEIELLFFCIPLGNLTIYTIERLDVGVSLEILILIKPDQINLIEDYTDQDDEYVDETSIHVLAFRYGFPRISRKAFYAIKI